MSHGINSIPGNVFMQGSLLLPGVSTLPSFALDHFSLSFGGPLAAPQAQAMSLWQSIKRLSAGLGNLVGLSSGPTPPLLSDPREREKVVRLQRTETGYMLSDNILSYDRARVIVGEKYFASQSGRDELIDIWHDLVMAYAQKACIFEYENMGIAFQAERETHQDPFSISLHLSAGEYAPDKLEQAIAPFHLDTLYRYRNLNRRLARDPRAKLLAPTLSIDPRLLPFFLKVEENNLVKAWRYFTGELRSNAYRSQRENVGTLSLIGGEAGRLGFPAGETAALSVVDAEITNNETHSQSPRASKILHPLNVAERNWLAGCQGVFPGYYEAIDHKTFLFRWMAEHSSESESQKAALLWMSQYLVNRASRGMQAVQTAAEHFIAHGKESDTQDIGVRLEEAFAASQRLTVRETMERAALLEYDTLVNAGFSFPPVIHGAPSTRDTFLSARQNEFLTSTFQGLIRLGIQFNAEATPGKIVFYSKEVEVSEGTALEITVFTTSSGKAKQKAWDHLERLDQHIHRQTGDGLWFRHSIRPSIGPENAWRFLVLSEDIFEMDPKPNSYSLGVTYMREGFQRYW